MLGVFNLVVMLLPLLILFPLSFHHECKIELQELRVYQEDVGGHGKGPQKELIAEVRFKGQWDSSAAGITD